jgi:SAM-dependent methyltransferase
MLMRPNEYRVMFEAEESYWWYRGLRVLLTALIARYAPTRRDAMILDAGCGTGANMKLLEAYGRVIGVDIAEPAIDFSRARGIPGDRVFLASVTDLPFRPNLFDLAISLDVICNIAEDVGAFAELARVLKRGGVAIVQMPAYQWLWSRHDVAVGHQRRYAARDLRDKLSRVGFHVERMMSANMLLFPFVAARRLLFERYSAANGRPVQSDISPLPRPLNALLSAFYAAEMRVASRIDFPYGLSLIAVARKR